MHYIDLYQGAKCETYHDKELFISALDENINDSSIQFMLVQDNMLHCICC